MRNISSTRPSRKRERASGFTLLEVMIALGLLAVGVLGVAGAQITALKYSRDSSLRAQAMFVAEQQLETIHGMSPINVIALKADSDYPDAYDPIDPTPGDGDPTTFERRLDISEDAPEVGVMTITVEVDWTNSLGLTQTLSLRSMKAS